MTPAHAGSPPFHTASDRDRIAGDDPSEATGRWLPGPACTACALALGLGLFFLRQRWIAGTLSLSAFPLDDSWIHLHFARNLAEGHGFAYNPGVPVAGSTAPAWTLLLAATFGLLGSQPGWAKALGGAAALGAALLGGRLAHRWTGDRGWGLLAAILTALAGPLVWGALSGMEVTLAALVFTGALLRLTEDRPWAAAFLLGLAVLCRPEAILVVPLVWLTAPTLRRAAMLVGVVGLMVLPWIVFNLQTAGTPWPATAAAKVEGGLLGLLSGRREALATELALRPWQFVEEWLSWLASANVLLPVLLVPGLWLLWRRWGRVAAAPAALLLLHPLGMALLAPYRGPGFQEGRYSIHLFPLAVAVAVSGLALAPRLRLALVDRHRKTVLGGALVVASLAALWPAAGRYGWGVQNIEAMHVHLGHWVARQTPREARLALNDVGAIAFLSRREVVDVMGLVTPEVIPYRRDGDAGVLRYIERACPDYLIIFPDWFRELAEETAYFTPVYRVRLDHNLVAGADEMVVYETAWNRWKPARLSCSGAPA